ncbi:MAG: YfhO family protein [Clostridiales bacterium]|nr:YfhO family protein [Clostridiales bacterium]
MCDRKSLRKFVPDFGVLLFLFVFSAFYYFKMNVWPVKLAGDLGDGWLSPIYSTYNVFRHGELSLWNPYLWCGMSAAGHTCQQTLYPIYLFLFVLRLPSFVTFATIVFTIHFFILSAGLYFFLRVNKVSWISAFVAVMMAITSAGLTYQSWWAYLFTGFVWHPFVLAFSTLAARQDIHVEKYGWQKMLSYIALSGICLGLSGLACPGQSLLVNVLTVCILWFCLVCADFSKRNLVNLTFRFLAIGFFSLAVCAPVLFLTIEYSKYCVRYVPEMGWVWPGEKLTIGVFLKHNINFSSFQNLFQFPEAVDYAGGRFGPVNFLLSLFGVCGFFVKVKEGVKPIQLFQKVLFACVILYASDFVLPYIAWYVPYLNAIREPFLYVPYLILPLTFFAGVGLDAMIACKASPVRLAKCVSSPVVMFFLLFIVLCSTMVNYTGAGRGRANIPIILLLVVSFVFTVDRFDSVALIKLLRKFVFSCLLAASVFVQMKNVSGWFSAFSTNNIVESKLIRVLDNLTRIEDFVSMKDGIERKSFGRFSSFCTRAWSSNSLSINRMRDVSGYMNPAMGAAIVLNGCDLKTRAVLEDIRYFFVAEDKTDELYDWSHGVVKTELGAQCLGTIDLFPDYDSDKLKTFSVWKVKTNGTAWLVNDIRPAPFFGKMSKSKGDKMQELLKQNLIDYERTAWISEDSLVKIEAGHNNWNVDVLSYNSNSVEYSVQSEKASLFVTSELWYPGWDMYVDGKKTKTLQVNLCFRGCEVPSGSHVIRMVYHPRLFFVGIVFLFLIIVFFVIMLVVKREEGSE